MSTQPPAGQKPKRTVTRDTPCPHCGVLFAKQNLPMHVSAKHGGATHSEVDKTPGREHASRSSAARAPASTQAPAGKREYDPLDPATW